MLYFGVSVICNNVLNQPVKKVVTSDAIPPPKGLDSNACVDRPVFDVVVHNVNNRRVQWLALDR